MIVTNPDEIELIYTNVTDNTEDEWSSSTTYDLNSVVKVTTSTPHKVYKSLRGNNTARVPEDTLEPVTESATSTTSVTVEKGSKTFTVQTGLSFSAGMIVTITKTQTPKTVNMTAEVSSYNSSTGELICIIYSISGEGTHDTWTIESEDEIGFWEEVGSTNMYAMFDSYVNTQTEFLEEIDVKLNVSRASHVSLFSIEGNYVEFSLWDDTETELLWSKDIDLVYGSSVILQMADWFEYFFGVYSMKEDAESAIDVITFSGILRIRITASTGETAKCGNVIVGRSYDIGDTTYGVDAGMVDFSSKTTDDIGRTTVTQGYWAKRNDITLHIDNYKLDSVYKTLTSLRGIPTSWSANNASTDYESLIIFGIITDFTITISGPNASVCSLEIEGLI